MKTKVLSTLFNNGYCDQPLTVTIISNHLVIVIKNYSDLNNFADESPKILKYLRIPVKMIKFLKNYFFSRKAQLILSSEEVIKMVWVLMTMC